MAGNVISRCHTDSVAAAVCACASLDAPACRGSPHTTNATARFPLVSVHVGTQWGSTSLILGENTALVHGLHPTPDPHSQHCTPPSWNT